MQIPGVSFPHRRTELLERQPLSRHLSRVFQSNITVRLNCERLVEFRRQRETQCHHVTTRKPVQRTAPSELKVSHAVRLSGFCDRSSSSPQPTPSLHRFT